MGFGFPHHTNRPSDDDGHVDDHQRLALYSGDETIRSIMNGLPHNGGSLSGSGTGSVSSGSGTGLVINIIWDASVSSAPTGFTNVVNQVVQYLEANFSDPITVNINVGYGKVGGSTMSPSALGQSSTYITTVSYSQLTTVLTADAKTAADASAVASLPSVDPTGKLYWVSTAEAKALGLPDPGTPVDGNVGFSSSAGIFDYDNSDGITAGQYDFYAVVEHEFSEVMGRILLTGASISGQSSYIALDLFHFSGNGVRTFSGSTPGYFSVDNGATSINTFNTASGGDRGDWAGATYDADNAYGSPGHVAPVSPGDLTALDAIGWDQVLSSPPPPPPPSGQPDLTVSGFSLSATASGLSANFQINNIGDVDAPSTSTARVYLSTDATITTSDTSLGSSTTAALLAGTSGAGSVSFAVPTVSTAGTYYVGVYADSSNAISEGSETNNASNALPVILGNSAGNTLNGTAGADIIYGQGGNDTLWGGGGADTMSGGAGNDHFVYKATSEGVDQILDFSVGSDSLDFSFAAFGRRLAVGGTNKGTLDPSHFVSNATGAATAHTAQFIYNTTTHMLSFDSDGTGAAGAVQIAHVDFDIPNTLHNTDIHIV